MGVLDSLFADAVINSVKRVGHNNSQQTLHGRVPDYDYGYEKVYDDCCYDHVCHDDCDSHDIYDCKGYDDNPVFQENLKLRQLL